VGFKQNATYDDKIGRIVCTQAVPLNASVPNVSGVPSKMTLPGESQSAKASSPIEVTFSGIRILVRYVFSNVRLPISVRPSGRLINVSPD
jgi:hypothetical protein